MQPTDLTVAAVVEHEGRFLFVEEYASGQRVFSQPGGHFEAGESPEQAVIRETREETACEIACRERVGVYSGRRQSDELLTGMLPLQHNVDQVIAKAELV